MSARVSAGKLGRDLVVSSFMLSVLCTAAVAAAEPAGVGPAARTEGGRVADRVVLRFVSPETGGSGKPRFFTERELALFTRIEALLEQSPVETADYPERYVRAAVDRLVARSMLSGLLVQRGSEPPDLERQALEARGELELRLGGAQVLAAAMKKEGIEDDEMLAFLRDEVRAAYYVDRMISPILAVTEDTLRETHRSTNHPFRGSKFDDVRGKLRRWIVTERLRAAELEFLQGARARVRITPILGPALEKTAAAGAGS